MADPGITMRFTVRVCPVCRAVQPDDGRERYCGATPACRSVGRVNVRKTQMVRVEVGTRDAWEDR